MLDVVIVYFGVYVVVVDGWKLLLEVDEFYIVWCFFVGKVWKVLVVVGYFVVGCFILNRVVCFVSLCFCFCVDLVVGVLVVDVDEFCLEFILFVKC